MTTECATKVIAPITRAFLAEKSKAWHYKIHPYYTKQPSNVVGEYIRHFCPAGGLVVDPFCGSGVTAVEALTNRMRTISDLENVETIKASHLAEAIKYRPIGRL